jgi:antitoxin component of MazEF toxin-antitoxin module
LSPLIRKLFKIGYSKAITIPKSWIKFIEKEHGVHITEVAIEVDQVLTIAPILSRIKTRKATSDNGRGKEEPDARALFIIFCVAFA